MLTQEELHGTKWENKEICSECKGRCCQKNACDCSPEDFDNDIQKMEEALKSGKYAIDFARTTANAFVYESWYLTLDVNHILKASDEVFYIRPRNQERPIVDIIHDKEIEGPCIFWTYEKGCELPYEKRPKFGRAIIPINPGLCKDIYPVRERIIFEWTPYKKQLFELVKKFFPDDWELYKKFNFKL